MFLYLTADTIGTPTGGGVVTYHESSALKELGDTRIVSRTELQSDVMCDPAMREPWAWDQQAYHHFGNTVKLAHVYAGTFGESVKKLKDNGAKVVYTIAAHDRAVSRNEHEKFGIPFADLYPHLVLEDLWQRYIDGYRLADVIVCPSTVAEKTVRAYGPEFASKRIEVIPHGCTIPDAPIQPLPRTFTVGYLGSYGPDKGVVYLLEAWKKLAYKDTMLLLAGKDSTNPAVIRLVEQLGLSNVQFMGWVEDVSTFYNAISLYAQPSATEGFGIEVLEALAHGRPVLCSEGAGAVDMVSRSSRILACDPDAMATSIRQARMVWDEFPEDNIEVQRAFRFKASTWSWDKVRECYKQLWREVSA